MDQTFNILSVIIVSYVIGSLPTAYLIARLHRVNIFEVGSKNMGATNVHRSIGLAWGLVVWVVDSFKGIVAILISRQIMSADVALATTVSALVVVVGHNWSLFAAMLTGRLRGGKGAATALGTLFWIIPLPVIVINFVISTVIVTITRYMSLGVLVMFALCIVWMTVMILQGQLEPIFLLYSVAMYALIVYRFRENIQRLLRGTERRLGEGA